MTDADLVRFLRSTTDAFDAALHAVLAQDQHAAREVLRGSAARRALRATSEAVVRERPWLPQPQKLDQLQFVSDVGRVGELLDRLARGVLVADASWPLTPARRMEVAVLLDAGGRRLRQLVDGPVAPGLDPAYRGCGGALFEVADRGGRDPSSTMRLCGALAVTLLQASRHATRVA